MAVEISNLLAAMGSVDAGATTFTTQVGFHAAIEHIAGSGVYTLTLDSPIDARESIVLLSQRLPATSPSILRELAAPNDSQRVVETFNILTFLPSDDMSFEVAVFRKPDGNFG